MNAENKIKTAFDSVGASESLKAATKSFLQEARRKEERRAAGHRLRMAAQAVCAAVLMLVIGLGGYTMLLVPVSYGSIDVNPSIELELNRIDRVISARAYNEDGERILECISVWGKHYTEALDLLVESSEMEPYLEGNAALVFTVASDSMQRENWLLEGVSGSSGCTGYGGMGVRTDVAIVSEAHECGLSLGKYAAYKLLLQYDSSISTEDCRNMTMSEIHGLLEEHGHKSEGHGSGGCRGDGTGGASGADEGREEGWGGEGNGSGHGHGHGHGR